MSDPATVAWLDQEDQRVADVIRRHGNSIEYVIGCTCCRTRRHTISFRANC
jgi:hypothetical protein